MKGISEPEVRAPMVKHNLRGRSISFSDKRPFISERAEIVTSALERGIERLYASPVSKKNVPYSDIVKQLDPDLKSYEVDISLNVTNIDFKDPIADIRLMFSPEGIWLPDSEGIIRSFLDLDNFSPQSVNVEIFRQAIVWPISRFSTGFWYSERVDVSRYSALAPLAELQWLGPKATLEWKL